VLVGAVVAIGAITVVVLLVLVTSLVRHLKRLGAAVESLNDELLPVLERLQSDAETVRAHMARTQTDLERLGEPHGDRIG
jgi:hypothetical protein